MSPSRTSARMGPAPPGPLRVGPPVGGSGTAVEPVVLARPPPVEGMRPAGCVGPRLSTIRRGPGAAAWIASMPSHGPPQMVGAAERPGRLVAREVGADPIAVVTTTPRSLMWRCLQPGRRGRRRRSSVVGEGLGRGAYRPSAGSSSTCGRSPWQSVTNGAMPAGGQLIESGRRNRAAGSPRGPCGEHTGAPTGEAIGVQAELRDQLHVVPGTVVVVATPRHGVAVANAALRVGETVPDGLPPASSRTAFDWRGRCGSPHNLRGRIAVPLLLLAFGARTCQFLLRGAFTASWYRIASRRPGFPSRSRKRFHRFPAIARPGGRAGQGGGQGAPTTSIDHAHSESTSTWNGPAASFRLSVRVLVPWAPNSLTRTSGSTGLVLAP